MSVESIMNFRKVDDRVLTGGQPTEEQFQAAAQAGVRTVINLAPAGGRNAPADEAGLVGSLGMRYLHIPVQWDNPTEGDFAAFEQAMRDLGDAKTLIHCAANFRVTAFYSLYALRHLGWSLPQAEAFRASIWAGSDYPVWERFIRQMHAMNHSLERSNPMTTATTLDLFQLCGEAVRAISTRYNDAMQHEIDAAEIDGQDWALAFLVRGTEPHAMTPEQLRAQTPYVAHSKLTAETAGAIERGILAADAAGGLMLTQRGRDLLANSFGAVHKAMVGYAPLPEPALERLAALLLRLVEATLAAPAPADKPAIIASRRTDPGAQSAAGARIDQYLTDLMRFRDDAHQAAWRPHGVDGPSWELFTFIWRGDADTAEALAEKLARRGHSMSEIGQALAGLVQRGWLIEQAGVYHVTGQGCVLREQAEELTNRTFYAPWEQLGAGEIDELRDLLTRLRDAAHEQAGTSTG